MEKIKSIVIKKIKNELIFNEDNIQATILLINDSENDEREFFEERLLKHTERRIKLLSKLKKMEE